MKIFLVIVLILIAVGGTWFFLGRDKIGSDFTVPGNTPTFAENAENQETGEQSNLEKLPEKINATIVTGRGNIVLELDPKVAPKTVANFLNLSQQKFYDGVKFHRVVPGFVIQGGDPLSKDSDPSNDGTGGPGYVFEDEINPKLLGLSDSMISQLEEAGYKYNFELQSLPVSAGVIAMANSGPNTNGSQFFIVTDKDQPHLNGRHTVFGKVIKGMDIVRKIQEGNVIKTISVKF